MKEKLRIKMNDHWVPIENTEGIVPVYCEVCGNLLGVRDSATRELKEAPVVEKVRIKIGDNLVKIGEATEYEFEVFQRPELDKVLVVKCRVCGFVQEV